MQGRIVDAIKAHELKQIAIRWQTQNVPEMKIRGLVIREALEYLDLWGEEDAEDTEKDAG